MPVTIGLVSAGIGGIQSLIGGVKGRKARRELENLQTPQYEKSRSITDYYNQALNRYQQSPTQSNLYKMQAQQIARGTAQGLSSLQDRRSALAGVPALVQNQNDAYLKAAATAEQDQNQKFAQLGAASQAMGTEDRQAFNINKMLPFQRKSDILGQKAAGYTQLMNAGMQNIYGGLTGAMMFGGQAKNSLASAATGGVVGNDPNKYSSHELQHGY
jgi:hypothetical protein